VHLAVAAALSLVAWLPDGFGSPNESTMTPSENTAPTSTAESSPVQAGVPQGILNPILKEAAVLAKVPREQLTIIRAEAAVWNDGSLGCPEPGMEYTQALVNGYWVVIKAAGQTYDFRVGRGGSFRLCPSGRGHPPRPSDAS
jgi:hypothetical protein